MIRYECYIEEYFSAGRLSARIREKKSNKRISIEIRTLAEQQHFLQFLSQAKINKNIMPTVFERNGTDIVAVYGIPTNETEDTIFIDIRKSGGGYLFE